MVVAKQGDGIQLGLLISGGVRANIVGRRVLPSVGLAAGSRDGYVAAGPLRQVRNVRRLDSDAA